MRQIIRIIFSVLICISFVQCDSTTAEEYKAQAIGFAENGEHEKAAQAYLEAAEKGDAESQFVVSLLYSVGDLVSGFSNNKNASLKWLEKSAKSGYPDALCFLGFHYAYELEAPDFAKAIDYWQKADKKNHSLAAYFLGRLYAEGKGVPVDQQKAIDYFKKAEYSGCMAAGISLALIYLKDNNTFTEGMMLYKSIENIARQVDVNMSDINSFIDFELKKIFQEYKL